MRQLSGARRAAHRQGRNARAALLGGRGQRRLWLSACAARLRRMSTGYTPCVDRCGSDFGLRHTGWETTESSLLVLRACKLRERPRPCAPEPDPSHGVSAGDDCERSIFNRKFVSRVASTRKILEFLFGTIPFRVGTSRGEPRNLKPIAGRSLGGRWAD